MLVDRFLRSVGAVALIATIAHAQPAPADPLAEPPVEPSEDVDVEAPTPSLFQVHGFISEGGFWSTDNEYIGASSRGSLELFEVGVNLTTQLTDRLRAGVQLFGRNVGTFDDLPPNIDWAYLDYRWRDWLGLRAGVIKQPFGLYNEYVDVDAARLSILMPGVYPLRDRTVLLSQTGFSLYGTRALGGAGEIDYQAWAGTLNIPENALELTGATLAGIDVKYVAGGQLFWRPPIDGLRIGATYLRTSLDVDVQLDADTIALLIMLGLVPTDYDGHVLVSQRPDTVLVGSVEYAVCDWLFAAEYSRWFKHQQTDLPSALPPFDEDKERFYALATRRFGKVEVGGYYAATHVDANDRQGRNAMKFPIREFAFQRDLAATVRYDVNEYWTWKLEGHFIDGVAELTAAENPDPERYWGLFLFKTTVTF